METVEDIIRKCGNISVKIRALSTDNHSVNVNLYTRLKCRYPHPNASNGNFAILFDNMMTYLIFDVVHLIKNIRNNWLKIRRFRVTSFQASVDVFDMHLADKSFIDWNFLNKVFDIEHKTLLKKAPLITFAALHPQNKKQNVPLALAIFDRRNSSAIEQLFPDDATAHSTSNFIKIVSVWWDILNSKSPNHSLQLANGIRPNDGKTDFLLKFALWVESWKTKNLQFFSEQTWKALVQSTRAIATLCNDLLNEDYDFILTSRFQTDALEKRFGRYRQISGGRFLVSLYELGKSEKIIKICQSLRHLDYDEYPIINASDDTDSLTVTDDDINNLSDDYSLSDTENEVAVYISGYIAKKIRNLNCSSCGVFLNENLIQSNDRRYIDALNRGGLTVPNELLHDSVCEVFSILMGNFSYFLKEKEKHSNFSEYVASIVCKKLTLIEFSCEDHHVRSKKILISTCVNIIFNNYQKKMKDSIKRPNTQLIKYSSKRRK